MLENLFPRAIFIQNLFMFIYSLSERKTGWLQGLSFEGLLLS